MSNSDLFDNTNDSKYFSPLTTTPNDSRCESEETETDTSSSSSRSSTHLEQFLAIGTWGTYGIDQKLFCDKYRPVVHFESYKDLELDEVELQGCLTDRIIASCSSYLEKCPQVERFVLCKCVLTNKRLVNINLLKYHHFLQYLDLSWNKLCNVSILEHLPFLIHLDVSHNVIEKLLDFRPPYNLSFVNYSHNRIKKLKDIQEFWALKSLNVSNNFISKIEGLETLRYLETLDLSFNSITRIENLDNLNIINLNLQHNNISSFICDNNKGFKTMPLLTYVRLGCNELTGLKMFEKSVFLQSIEVQENNISGLIEISHLQNLNLLLAVNFNKNPVKNCSSYEEICIETIKNLHFLDGSPVAMHKKIFSKASFNHETKMQASQDHASILTLSHLTALPRLGLSVVPCDTPPRPIIVVVSPIGSRQDMLIKTFAKQHADHVTRLLAHTDREMSAGEHSTDYHFVFPKEFDKLMVDGQFLMTYSILSDNYGLSQEEFGRGVKESGKVMIIGTDLNAALAFRLRGFRPFIVLAMPRSKQIHRQWLMETYETQVFNIRYPEAAIKIFNRDNSTYSTMSEKSTSSSANVLGYMSNNCVEKSVHSNTEDYYCSDSIQVEDETYYDEVQKIYRRLSGMRNYCCMNPTLEKLYVSQINSFQSSEDQCNCQGDILRKCEDYNKQFRNLSNTELSCEGSTIIFPENLIQDFYTKVINSRELYFEFHKQNPGIFYDVVFTDELDSALEKLKHVAKMAMRTQLTESHFKKFDHKSICQRIIQDRIHILEDDIERAMVRNVNCTK